jgi:hypothetical protein
MSWLLQHFSAPERVELPSVHHVRPIRETNVDIDYPAVMGSRSLAYTVAGAGSGRTTTVSTTWMISSTGSSASSPCLRIASGLAAS